MIIRFNMHGFLRSPGGSSTSRDVEARNYDLRSRGYDWILFLFLYFLVVQKNHETALNFRTV